MSVRDRSEISDSSFIMVSGLKTWANGSRNPLNSSITYWGMFEWNVCDLPNWVAASIAPS